ncbi:hypothetical protein HY768_03810, partial [candidate division TA06 bacterium]|nr:hypothetical protein [candidate division TA06 bacterium]
MKMLNSSKWLALVMGLAALSSNAVYGAATTTIVTPPYVYHPIAEGDTAYFRNDLILYNYSSVVNLANMVSDGEVRIRRAGWTGAWQGGWPLDFFWGNWYEEWMGRTSNVPGGDPDGMVYFIDAQAESTDAAWNNPGWGPTASKTPMIRDRTAPDSVITFPRNLGWVSSGTSNVSGTVYDALAGVDSVLIRVFRQPAGTLIAWGGGALSGPFRARNFTWSWTVPAGDPDGTQYDIETTAWDRAYDDPGWDSKGYVLDKSQGNQNQWTIAVYKDTQAPTSTILTPDNNAAVTGTARITGIADDNDLAGVDSVKINCNDGLGWRLVAPLSTPGNYTNWYYDWNAAPLADGAYNIQTQAFDKAVPSNIETVGPGIILNVDNTAPVWASLLIQNPDDIFHNGEIITLLAALDAPGYNLTCNFSPIDNQYVTGAEQVADNGDNTYTIRYAISEVNSRANGNYLATATAKDFAGRTANDSISLRLDNSGPKTSGVDFALDPLNDNILNANDTLAAVVKDTNGVIAAEYFIDNTGYDGAGAAISGTFGPDSVLVKGFLNIGGLSQGRHTAYVHGQDSTRVWGGYASLNFTVDTQGPSIENLSVIYPNGQTAVTVNDPVTITALIRDVTTEVDTLTVRADATSPNGNTSVRMYDDGAHGDYAAGDKVYTAKVAVTNTFSGPVTITVWASDIVPNASSVSGLNLIVPEVAKDIGPAGGTVKLADGAKLMVPVGALNKTVRISIKRFSPLATPEATKTLFRHGYQILPANLIFNQDAELTLPYSSFDLDPDQDGTLEISEQRVEMFYWTHDQWLTQTVKSRLTDSNSVLSQVNHLGVFALGQKSDATVSPLKVWWSENPMVYGGNTQLVYQLNKPGKVSLNIYDMSGDLVYSFSERPGLAGENNFSWDGRAKTG